MAILMSQRNKVTGWGASYAKDAILMQFNQKLYIANQNWISQSDWYVSK